MLCSIQFLGTARTSSWCYYNSSKVNKWPSRKEKVYNRMGIWGIGTCMYGGTSVVWGSRELNDQFPLLWVLNQKNKRYYSAIICWAKPVRLEDQVACTTSGLCSLWEQTTYRCNWNCYEGLKFLAVYIFTTVKIFSIIICYSIIEVSLFKMAI